MDILIDYNEQEQIAKIWIDGDVTCLKNKSPEQVIRLKSRVEQVNKIDLSIIPTNNGCIWI